MSIFIGDTDIIGVYKDIKEEIRLIRERDPAASSS